MVKYSSFLYKLLYLLSSSSYFLSNLTWSNLSLNSARDISSNRPNPIVSVGSYPLVLLIGYFSNSLICLISSSLLIRIYSSSCFFNSNLRAISSLYSSAIYLFFSTTFSTYMWTFFSASIIYSFKCFLYSTYSF